MLLKSFSISFKRVLVDNVLSITFTSYCYRRFRIVSYDTTHNRISSYNIFWLGKATKCVVEVLEPLVRLHIKVRVRSKRNFLLLNLQKLLILLNLFLKGHLLILEEIDSGFGLIFILIITTIIILGLWVIIVLGITWLVLDNFRVCLQRELPRVLFLFNRLWNFDGRSRDLFLCKRFLDIIIGLKWLSIF